MTLYKIENLDYIYPQGAFYVFIDISKVKDKFEYKESLSIPNAIPGTIATLYSSKNLSQKSEDKLSLYSNLSFACSEETFIEALDRLDKFVQGILA